MSINEKIKNARQAAGLTQKQLSEKTGLIETTIRKYEAGTQNPKIKNLQKIADALGLCIMDFADRVNDSVNHPAHYTSGKIEVIDFIDDKELGFCLDNAVKYIVRAGKKDPVKTVEDLQKAVWYINHHIEILKIGVKY